MTKNFKNDILKTYIVYLNEIHYKVNIQMNDGRDWARIVRNTYILRLSTSLTNIEQADQTGFYAVRSLYDE